MRANYVGNTSLQERLHRPEPAVRAIVEAVVVSAQDTKETDGEWSSADSQTGLTFPQIGGARLARDTNATLASYAVASGSEGQVTTDVDNELPYHIVEVKWTAPGAPDWEIHDLTTKIDPDVDGTGREVDRVYGQLYQVTREDFDGEDTREIRAISARRSVDISGNAETSITFDFSGADVGTPPTADRGRETTRPKTWLMVRAVTADGEPAGNIAWIGDPTESNPTTDDQTNAELRHYVIDQLNTEGRISVGGQYLITNPSPGGLPEFSVGSKTYTEATASFTGSSNQIDLGSAPASDTDLVVVAQGEEPADSSLIWELSDDSGTSWTPVADGDVIGEDNTSDGGNDLSSVSRQQTYDMRVTLTPSSDGHTSPFARRIGVEELTTTDLDAIADVEDAGNWSFDPVTLVGEIPEATLSILKDGVRDYRSEGERLFAENFIGDMTFRVWIGHPNLPRQHWLHVDTFEVDDYSSEGGAIEVTGLSPLRRLKTGVPPFDASANERTPVEYTNETLKSAWDDLLDSQVALPGRFRGPGVEDTDSQAVSKTLRDSDGKTELDAIAHLAGGTVVTSQGRVKYQNTFTEEKGAVRATFPREEVQITGVTPGYRNRVEEYFVPYAFDDDRDDFDGEVRSFYASAISKLGGKGLDMEEELDEAVARWLPTPNDTTSRDPAQNLAAHVAHRTASADGLGPGLKQVRLESVVPHPELEPGDVVTVETDQLVLKDPATDRSWRGNLWLTGVVQVQHDIWGRELTVWVQQIEDAIPAEEDVGKDEFDESTLNNFRITQRDKSTIRYEWARGGSVAQVWVYNNLVNQPVTADNWPDPDTAVADAVLDTQDFYEAGVPRPDKVRLLQFEPRDNIGVSGEVWRAMLRPSVPREDRLVSMGLSTDEQLNVDLSVETVGCSSIRYVVDKVDEPTVAEIEAGTISTTVNGTLQDVASLGIDGSGNLEEAWVGVAAYKNDNGKGPDGANDHDDVKIQKIGGEGVGSQHATPATDPNLRSTDPDTSSLTGVDILWDAFTLKVADFTFDIASGSKSGKDGDTKYRMYWDISDAAVKAVKEANIEEVIGLKRLLWGTITTVVDKDDGTSSDTNTGDDELL